MKMKYLIAIAPFLLMQKIMYSQIHFPLHVGDIWGYSYGTCDNLMIEIIDRDTVIGGKSYFHYHGASLYGATHVRYAGQVLYAYDTTSHAEYPLFDFTAKAGDTISSLSSRHWIALGNMRFFRTIPLGLYEGMTFTVKDSVGVVMVTQTTSPCTWFLTSVMIDGKHVTVSVATGSVPEPSVALQLFEPYPNPFNPSTTIRYSLPAGGPVRMSISDILGREVSEIVNDRKDAGEYATVWDASNCAGGVYFVRLISGSQQRIRKIFLLK